MERRPGLRALPWRYRPGPWGPCVRDETSRPSSGDRSGAPRGRGQKQQHSRGGMRAGGRAGRALASPVGRLAVRLRPVRLLANWLPNEVAKQDRPAPCCTLRAPAAVAAESHLLAPLRTHQDQLSLLLIIASRRCTCTLSSLLSSLPSQAAAGHPYMHAAWQQQGHCLSPAGPATSLHRRPGSRRRLPPEDRPPTENNNKNKLLHPAMHTSCSSASPQPQPPCLALAPSSTSSRGCQPHPRAYSLLSLLYHHERPRTRPVARSMSMS